MTEIVDMLVTGGTRSSCSGRKYDLLDVGVH